jgi:Ser/Thr protein kinase RdoA (MazF antagonist)
VGVIDWNDAHVDWLVQEVAWSTWEFCKNGAGNTLLADRAAEFVAAYKATGGPGLQDADDLILPFIRLRLRDEIRGQLAASARGLPGDAAYAAAECRAFTALRDSSLLTA